MTRRVSDGEAPARAPRWISELGLSFTLVGLVAALPVYERIYRSPGTFELLRLVFLIHLLPTAVLFLVSRWLLRLDTPTLHRLFWLLCVSLALYSLSNLLFAFWSGSGLPALAAVLLGGLTRVDWLRENPDRLRMVTAVLAALPVIVFLAGSCAYLISRRSGPLATLRGLLTQISPIMVVVTAYLIFASIGPPATTSAASARALDQNTVDRSGPVFIIVLDELGRDVLLKDGQVDRERFPNLRALADEGVWFTNATANYGMTCQAMPSLLTGRFVPPSQVSADVCANTYVADGVSNLLVALNKEHEISVYEDYLRDCRNGSPYHCHGMSSLAADYPQVLIARHLAPLPALRRGLFGIGDSIHTYTLTLFDALLHDVAEERSPSRAYFIHLALPHNPFEYSASGEIYGTQRPNEVFTGDEANDSVALPKYVEQVRLVDALIGQLVRRLHDEGLYASSTVVVTSDHGPRAYATGSGALMTAGLATPEIPLLIRSPHLATGVSTIDYQHVDFAPTLLDLLGVQPLADMDGYSAFASNRPERAKTFSYGMQQWVRDTKGGTWLANAVGERTQEIDH